jgi:hypothetical protein
MTNEQAEQRWCPFTGGAITRRGITDIDLPTSRCISSNCMAWRETSDVGYCGLVGSPGHVVRPARPKPSWQRDAAGDAGGR